MNHKELLLNWCLFDGALDRYKLRKNWEISDLLGMAFPCSTRLLYFSIKFWTVPCTPVRSTTWLTIHFWFLDITETFQFLFWKVKISLMHRKIAISVVIAVICPYQDRVVDRIGWHDPKVTFQSILYQLRSQRKFWLGMGIRQDLRLLHL